MDNWECGGSNVWILFVKSLTKVALIISNFTVERTEISYGVNFRPRISLYSNGAGVILHLDHVLGYDIQITIILSANLYVRIFSSCSCLVKD